MKAFWKKFHRKVNSLTLRERKLIALASSSFVIGIFVTLFWLPIWSSMHKSISENNQHIIQIETTQNSIAALELRSKKDVNLPYRIRLKELNDKVDQQEENINNITTALIRPEKMNQVFKGLLTESQLKFESIKNNPAGLIVIGESEKTEQTLFEHGLTLEMTGKYFNSLDYIQTVEQQNWQLYWDELEFSIIQYPIGRLRLRVHTLSTSDKVLGL